VNQDLAVESWDAMAEEFWGVRENEALGRTLINLDIGLPAEQLVDAIRSCLSGRERLVEQVIDATNRRGRAIRCRVRVTALAGGDGPARGVILLVDALDA
jgi:two-component system CheB/CheR fusion protein